MVKWHISVVLKVYGFFNVVQAVLYFIFDEMKDDSYFIIYIYVAF